MYANSWLYHYYSVQSKIQFGLPYDGATRVQSTNSSYYPNHHHHHYQQHHQHHSPNSLSHSYMATHHMSAYGYLSPIPQHQGSPGLISHYNGTTPQLSYHNPSYTYQTIDSQPVDYRSQTSSQIETVCNGIQSANVINDLASHNGDSKSPPSKRRAVLRLEPLYIPEHQQESSDASNTDIHYQINEGVGAVAISSTVTPIIHNRVHLKAIQTDLSDTIDQWNPSPPWSETTQKVPDIVQQELSPYLARTPPTPTSAPLPQASTNGQAFSFDWMPEQFVPIMDSSHSHINATPGMLHDGVATIPLHVTHWPHIDHKFLHVESTNRIADDETKGK